MTRSLTLGLYERNWLPDLLADAKDGRFSVATFEGFEAAFHETLRTRVAAALDVVRGYEAHMDEYIPALVHSLSIASCVRDGKNAVGNGMKHNLTIILDTTLHPSLVQGEKGLLAMNTLVQQYFAAGGCAIHFNVFSAEELRDAQRHPEKYQNLQVRVCGWNVRWNDLGRTQQDAYIRRAENVR